MSVLAHKLRDLETWSRNNGQIDWGCDRDLPVLARNRTKALIYHPPGKVWVARFQPMDRVPIRICIHDLARTLDYVELPLVVKNERRMFNRDAFVNNRIEIDRVFGPGAFAVIAATIDNRWRRPIVTVVFND